MEGWGIVGIRVRGGKNGGCRGRREMGGLGDDGVDRYVGKVMRGGKGVGVWEEVEEGKKKGVEIKGKKGVREMEKMVKGGISEVVRGGVGMGDKVVK